MRRAFPPSLASEIAAICNEPETAQQRAYRLKCEAEFEILDALPERDIALVHEFGALPVMQARRQHATPKKMLEALEKARQEKQNELAHRR